MIEGRFGVWSIPLRTVEPDAAVELAERLTAAGFGTIWVPGGAEHSLVDRLDLLLRRGLNVASGVLVTWRHPAPVISSWVDSLNEQQRGRLTLGIGVSHRELDPVAAVKPRQQLVDYMNLLDEHLEGSRPTVVVGALGPVMTRLAAEFTDGIHPYLVTPDHTRAVRATVGDGPLLAPEQAVVLDADPVSARAAAREHLAIYLERVNYVRNWRRLGFVDEDFEHGGSDRFVDAMVAWGDDERVASRVREHLSAGADHVAVQVLQPAGSDPASVPWERLSMALRSSDS